MNDEATPTTATASVTQNDTSSSAAAVGSDGSPRVDWLRKRRLAPFKRKADFVSDLMFKLDLTIYAELVFLYYLDCSFFRFIIRVLAQIMFLTPKPQFMPPPSAKHRPYIGAIFGPNAICALLHIFTRLPQAGEMTRGHLHGGIIIDFIGQKPPTTKFELVLLDLLVTFLQCFMLAVHVEQERLKVVIAAPAFSSEATPVAANPTQDHDSEERGVNRDIGMTADDVEMQTIRPPEPSDSTEDERGGLLSDERLQETSDLEGPLDVFYTGNAIIADFHVMHTLRTQWEDYDNATNTALQTVGASAGYSLARMNLQMRRFENMR